MKDYDGNDFKPEEIMDWYDVIKSEYLDIKAQHEHCVANPDSSPVADDIRIEFWGLEARYEEFLEEYPEVLV